MKQPWIRSATFDSAWFLAPVILPVLAVFCFPSFFQLQNSGISVVPWVLLVLLVDVAHVYSTVYRTYFNKTSLGKFSTLLKAAPIICWICGVLLYSLDPLLFWRCMAYLAVFHFIRQQYGFMRIYSRNQTLPLWIHRIHTISIYSVTLLPILIWHAEGPKNFNWFIEGDFYYFTSPILVSVFKFLFFIVCFIYLGSEVWAAVKFNTINIPRLLLVSGTALSWYAGIVLFNGDLIFTMLNVLAHGIPYMALIWVSEKKDAHKTQVGIIKYFFRSYGVILFIGLLCVFAYLEEGLWDSMLWREHKEVFGSFYFLSQINHPKALAFLVPLLSLPQIVHYVVDGFIWKRSKMGDNALS